MTRLFGKNPLTLCLFVFCCVALATAAIEQVEAPQNLPASVAPEMEKAAKAPAEGRLDTASTRFEAAAPMVTQSIKAFPTAEGFGANAVGGHGGRVITVTNLNDSGPGSLREALSARGPRIIRFAVEGAIEQVTSGGNGGPSDPCRRHRARSGRHLAASRDSFPR